MHVRLLASFMAATVTLGVCHPAAAVEVSYDFGLFSHYVWRGIALTEGPVVQPSVVLAHRSGFSLQVWGNVDATNDNDSQGELNEIRITAQYTWRFEHFELAVGAIDYSFPNSPFPGTWETFVSVRTRTVVAPRLTFYYDVDEVEDVYANLAIEFQHELGRHWRASLSVSAGFAGRDFAIGGKAGLHDGNVELVFTRRGNVDFTLLGTYTESLDDEVLIEQPVGPWAGVRWGVRF